MEEAHNLFPTKKNEWQFHNRLETIFREVRGFGQGVIVISQHLSKIPLFISGNCGTQIHLMAQHEDDLYAIKRSLFLRDEHCLNQLKVGEAFVKIQGRVNEPCHIKFPLVHVKKGVVTDTYLRGQHAETKVG